MVVSPSVTCEGTGYFIDDQYTGSTSKTVEIQGICLDDLPSLQLSGADKARNTVKMRHVIEQVINVVILFLSFVTYTKYLIAHIRS